MLVRSLDSRWRTAHLGDEPAGPSLFESPCEARMQKSDVNSAFPLFLAYSKSQLLLLLLEEPVRLLSVLLHLSSTSLQAMRRAWLQHRNLSTPYTFCLGTAAALLGHRNRSAAANVTNKGAWRSRDSQKGAILICESWHDYKRVMCQARSGRA